MKRIRIAVVVGSLMLIPFFIHAQYIDSDGDGLSDDDEVKMYFTDPAKADTDNDGFNDGEEIASGYSPRYGDKKRLTQVDSDRDYLNDAFELAIGTGLMDSDSDDDTYLDGTEVAAGYDPLNDDAVTREKKITVDLKSQQLEYFFGDVKLGSFLISSGLTSMPTPRGSYIILEKVPVKYYGGVGFDYPNTKWNLQFTTKNGLRYYIHGAYWHNNFGKPMSHGCVNVGYANMEPLYWWAQKGTKVSIQ